MVERRFIYALEKGVYMGRPKIVCRFMACMQSEGRFFMVGKSFIAVDLFDCLRVPTYHKGSS